RRDTPAMRKRPEGQAERRFLRPWAISFGARLVRLAARNKPVLEAGRMEFRLQPERRSQVVSLSDCRRSLCTRSGWRDGGIGPAEAGTPNEGAGKECMEFRL